MASRTVPLVIWFISGLVNHFDGTLCICSRLKDCLSVTECRKPCLPLRLSRYPFWLPFLQWLSSYITVFLFHWRKQVLLAVSFPPSLCEFHSSSCRAFGPSVWKFWLCEWAGASTDLSVVLKKGFSLLFVTFVSTSRMTASLAQTTAYLTHNASYHL